MSPKQIFGWLGLARLRRQTEMAELLAITMMGSRGDPEEVKRQIKAWQE